MSSRFAALFAVVGALLLMPLTTGAAWAQKRVALVIGNGVYQTVAKLPNPIKDATAIAEMFKKAGFDWVKTRQDLGNLEFKRALREFMDAAQDADVAVVYYAGHGIQVGDMNYMIPVDARLATEIDAEDEAVSLDRIVMALEPAKRLRLVILDACRDNPFARTMKRRVAMRAITGGLAKMEPTLGETLIAYAAKAGSTAEDGDGENSPFAAALLKNLTVPGLDIRLAFGQVRDDVLRRTGNRQEPFVYGSVGGEAIALVPAPAQPKVEVLNDVKGDYTLVERIGTKKAWEVFLSSHKEGLYAGLARAQLDKLVEAESNPAAESARTTTLASIGPVTPPRPSEQPSAERRVWDRIRDSGDRAKLRDFIAKYPASPLAETAKNRLDALDRAAQEREDKARAEREAAQRRDEEAARKLAEREAAQRRDEEDKRLKAEAQPTPDIAREPPPQQAAPQQVPAPQQPAATTPDLIASAQSELRRLGCFAGQDDGKLGGATTDAIKRYLSQKGHPTKDVKVTDSLVADLKDQTARVCPLTCSRNEHAEGDVCAANTKPEKQEQPKATARQSDEDAKAKREQAKREQAMREEARREVLRREERRHEAARPKPERAAARPAPQPPRPAPEPAARSQAAAPAPAPRHSGGIIGVGF